MDRFKHDFIIRDTRWVWVSDTPHAYGLLRIRNKLSTDIGGEGLLKAFTSDQREVAIEYAKHQRSIPLHDGYRLKLVPLVAEAYTPQAQSGATGSHAACDHPSTPAARRDCRARRKAGLL